MNSYTKNTFFWIVFATAIPLVYYIYNPGKIVLPTLIMGLLIVVQLYKLKKRKALTNIKKYKIITYWLYIIVFGLLHSVYNGALNYKDLPMFVQSFLSISLLFVLYTIKDASDIKIYIRYFYIIYIPVAIYSYFNWSGFLGFDVSHILLPLTLYLVIVPYESKKSIIYSAFILIIALISDTSVRSALLSYAFILAFYIICYIFNNKIIQTISKYTRVLLLCTPLVLFLLGISGKYNVFQDLEKIEIVSDIGSAKNRENVLLDTRTGVYIDALNALDSPKNLLIGRGAITTIECSSFSSYTDEYDKGRHSVEAGILNILLFYGVFGFLFFTAMIVYVSRVGMYKTNNLLTMLASVYLSFKFMYMFVEDATINISTYIAIGICLNENIRKLTNEQIKLQIKKII